MTLNIYQGCKSNLVNNSKTLQLIINYTRQCLRMKPVLGEWRVEQNSQVTKEY